MRIIRQGILFGLTLLAPLVGAAAIAAPPTQPNILWLIGEDMGPQLGCYGTAEVWTPHLDRLAADGVRFTQAFTTSPVCSASRSALMTGMYQTTIGAHNHRSHRDDEFPLPPDVRLLTDWLRDAGYYTANIGRITDQVKGTRKTDWNFHTAGEPFDTDRWDDLKQHEPFFAQVNFSEAHRSFDAPRRADPQKVAIPPYYPDHPLTREDWAGYLDEITLLDEKIGVVLAKLAEDGLADRTVVCFLGDHGQAMVRGKQWCHDSGLHIPLIIHWPKALPAPSQYRPGAVDESLIAAIDLTATTLAIAGVAKPEKMQGRVFWGEQAKPPRTYIFSARDRCDETVFRIRTARDERYRYIRNFMPERPFLQLNRYKERQYPVIALMRRLHAEGELTPTQQVLMAPHRPAEELYDLEADPHEIHNLAHSAEHLPVLEKMRGAVAGWIDESDDQGRFPEPPEVLEYWDRVQRERE